MKNFKDFGIKPPVQGLTGDKIKIERILNRQITVTHFIIDDSKYGDEGTKRLALMFMLDGVPRLVFTNSRCLQEMIARIPPEEFPFNTTIVKENERYEFT